MIMQKLREAMSEWIANYYSSVLFITECHEDSEKDNEWLEQKTA
jgi:hypothetical protein